jgi:hypothetical protein
MQKSLANIDVQLPFLKNLESALGKSLRNTPNGIQEGITEAVGEADVLRTSCRRSRSTTRRSTRLAKRSKQINCSLDARKGQRQSFFRQHGHD